MLPLRTEDNKNYINVRAYHNNEWRLGVRAGNTSREAKVTNRSTKQYSLVGVTWDTAVNKAVINVRSEDGTKGRAEVDTPKDTVGVLNDLRIGDFTNDTANPVAAEDNFSGDVVELVVWPFAMGWEDRTAQEMKFMQYYFVNPGPRY